MSQPVDPSDVQLEDSSKESHKYSEVTDKHVLICKRIHYDIIVGDLADSTDDTVVNSTGSGINLKVSVAKALAEKSGPELATICAKHVPLSEGKILITSGFNMACKQILHCNCPDWDKKTRDNSILKKIVILCLETAAKKGHTSIALPAIGMGIKGYPTDVVASSLVQAVTEYAEKNPQSSVTKVKLYLYKGDVTDSLLRVFNESFKLTEDEKIDNGFKLENGVVFEVFKGDLAETKADVIVNSTGSHMSMSSGKVSLALLNKAGKELQVECAKMGSLDTGKIVMTDGFGLPCASVLHVNCPRWVPGKTEQILLDVIIKCLNWTKDEKARSIAFPAIGTGILGYPPETVARCFLRASSNFAQKNPKSSVNRIMLIAFTKDVPTIKGFQRALGMEIKCQSKKDTEDSKSLFSEGKVVIDLPSYWEKPVSEYREFDVSERTTEWKDVATSFKSTIGRPADQVSILKVTRVQNPRNFSLYDTMKGNVANSLNKQPHEVETAPLWHATAQKNIQKITRNNFDRGLSGTVGGNLLGAGCYFSKTSAYSDDWNSPQHGADERFMIMVRVVTGEYCKGNPTLKQAPYKPGSQIEQYDSVVENVQNPTKFVVFHDASTYPEYIIKYKFIQGSKSTPAPAPPPPVSTTTRPAPTTTRPAPTSTRPAPITTRPAPTTTRPAPTTTSSSSSDDSNCCIL